MKLASPFGRWEKDILRRVRESDFWLREILPAGHTNSEYVAACRAARSLAAQGYIRYAFKKDGNRERMRIERGRRKLPDLPPTPYVLARVRLPEMAKEAE